MNEAQTWQLSPEGTITGTHLDVCVCQCLVSMCVNIWLHRRVCKSTFWRWQHLNISSSQHKERVERDCGARWRKQHKLKEAGTFLKTAIIRKKGGERDQDRCNKDNYFGTIATNNQKEQLLTFFACPSKARVFWEVARTNPVSTAFRAFLAYRYAVARL